MEVAHVTPVTRTPLSRSKGQGHVVNIVPTRKMCHIFVADKPTLFECRRLTECVHFLVTDCKFPPSGRDQYGSRPICLQSRKRLSVTRWERRRHPVVALTFTFVTWRVYGILRILRSADMSNVNALSVGKSRCVCSTAREEERAGAYRIAWRLAYKSRHNHTVLLSALRQLAVAPSCCATKRVTKARL